MRIPLSGRAGPVAVSLLALALTACGPGDAPESGPRIAFMGLAAQNTYSQAAYEGARYAVEAAGGRLTYFDGQFKADVQYNQILDIATSQGYDGVLVMPNDGASIAPAAERAIRSGLSIVAVEFPIGREPTNLSPQIEGITATVGYDAYAEAVTWAERVIEVCADDDECNVAWMMGDRTTLFDRIRWDAITATLVGHPNVTVVSVTDMHWARPDGLAAAQTILTRDDGNLDVITGPDSGILGAQDALAREGRANRYTLIGQGTTIDGLAQVAAGNWDSSAGVHEPARAGEIGAGLLIDALAGRPVRDTVDMVRESPIGPIATQESLERHPGFTGQWN